MTIKEVEKITGLTRSNIRFYEKEKLLSPARNENNGYREYSEEDIKTIRKVAYLRTLGISVEDIRRLSNHEIDLYNVLQKQRTHLEQQLSELEYAKMMCENMLSSNEKIDYDHLEIGQYVDDVKDYWRKNNTVFKLDSVGFFYLWGGKITWSILTAVSFFVAVCSIRYLPAEIPVQWHGDIASTLVDKHYIFAFPVACVIIRLVLRPMIWQWLPVQSMDRGAVADYISNYLCFLAVSVELFIILYVNDILKNVTVILGVDTVVFLGLLILVVYRTKLIGKVPFLSHFV